MTSLVRDAICTETTAFPVQSWASSRIKPEVLQELIKNLDEREIISIIFLMVDKDSDIPTLIKQMKEDLLTVFMRLSSNNAWAEKLLESLLIIGNKEVVGFMGFNQNQIQDMEQSFLTRQHNISPTLNKAIKSLYLLCENLDRDQVIKLIKDVNNELSQPLDIVDRNLYLEYYILEWISQKYISIDPDKVDLSNLLKNLKHNGFLLDLPPDLPFDDWEKINSSNNPNEQDSQIYPTMSNSKNTTVYLNRENSLNSHSHEIMWSSEDHKKLLIIINQINFTDKKKYEPRQGSEMDQMSLKETFEGCGFEVITHKDLTKQAMVELLDSLNSKDESYATYGAIFICILSHGFKGEVIFSDDEPLSIDFMKEKFCCRKLQRVFKCLILQSCQGQQIGKVERFERNLVEDGPNHTSNPLLQLHFCLFQSTIENFAAMRDKKEGSWFIQDLCRVIKEKNGPIEIRYLIQNVTERVTSRRAPDPSNRSQEIVQVPLCTASMKCEYFI